MSINLTFLMHDLLCIKKAMCPDDETLGDDACGFTLRVRNSSRLVTNTLKTFMVIKPRPITDQCALTVLVWVHIKIKSEGVTNNNHAGHQRLFFIVFFLSSSILRFSFSCFCFCSSLVFLSFS